MDFIHTANQATEGKHQVNDGKKPCTPSLGYCVVRIVDKSMTEAGLHIPESAQQSDSAFLVKAHPQYVLGGHLFEHGIPEGARILVAPKSPMTSYDTLPAKHYVMRTSDIMGWDIPPGSVQ